VTGAQAPLALAESANLIAHHPEVTAVGVGHGRVARVAVLLKIGVAVEAGSSQGGHNGLEIRNQGLSRQAPRSHDVDDGTSSLRAGAQSASKWSGLRLRASASRPDGPSTAG
jgi:hypothetical protein